MLARLYIEPPSADRQRLIGDWGVTQSLATTYVAADGLLWAALAKSAPRLTVFTPLALPVVAAQNAEHHRIPGVPRTIRHHLPPPTSLAIIIIKGAAREGPAVRHMTD